MNNSPNWLPPLVLFQDFQGNWNHYLDAIYAYFKQDFVESSPKFQGRRFRLKRHPMRNGKDATFWHLISKGQKEESRTPDFKRCERIRWPKPVIEHDSDTAVKVWKNRRGHDDRICLWVEDENYLVVLADRGNYILLWTAYLVEKPHQQVKLRREYEEYWKQSI